MIYRHDICCTYPSLLITRLKDYRRRHQFLKFPQEVARRQHDVSLTVVRHCRCCGVVRRITQENYTCRLDTTLCRAWIDTCWRLWDGARINWEMPNVITVGVMQRRTNGEGHGRWLVWWSSWTTKYYTARPTKNVRFRLPAAGYMGWKYRVDRSDFVLNRPQTYPEIEPWTGHRLADCSLKSWTVELTLW